jgi:hypothetical protein
MGVPELLAAEIAAPFERMSDVDAAALVSRLWGISPERAVRVDTERDDTFRLETADGSYALKIAHPADDPAVIDLQTAAIEWAAAHDACLSLPRPLPTLDGRLHPVDGGRIARLFPWMPGQSLRAALWDAAPSVAQLHAIGATHARLCVALAGFRHPAESRVLAWDVAQLPSLAGLLDAVADPAPVAAAFARHVAEIAPRIAALPQQLIHNDGNLDNLLVDDLAHSGSQVQHLTTGMPRITVLDFGDVVRTARVLDLAVTASYLLPVDDLYGASDTLAELAAGWIGVLPLEPHELELLPRLVIARLVQRILLASWLSTQIPENAEYLGRNLAISRAQLNIALSEGF